MNESAGTRSIIVRRAQSGDTTALQGLYDELGYPATLRETEDRLRAVLRHHDHVLFVAENDTGEIAGCVHATALPILENDLTLQIFALVVRPSQRRSGIGRRLVAAAEEWGAANGCQVCYLRCNVKRESAHRFWSAIGYENRKTQYAFRKPL